MIWKPTDENISTAGKILLEGGIGAIPTETVYGLAGNALDTFAVAKIFEAKNRPTFNPLIVHIHSMDQLKKIVDFDINSIQEILENFWPGPFTIVLPKKNIISDLITGSKDSVAVRMPNHQITLKLLKQFDLMVAAPSANPFNYISPTSAQHVEDQLGSKINFILDGGLCSVGVESTVVSFVEKNPVLLRHGGISVEEIRKWIPNIEENTLNELSPDSPGQLKHHYSPKTPLKFWMGEELNSDKIGFLSWDVIPENNSVKTLLLSDKQNFIEAASRLFDLLHQFDKMQLDIIYVQPIPEIGLGRAVMDRLKRAVNN
jgi:L-threonylcarbamoyladenylate synthase